MFLVDYVMHTRHLEHYGHTRLGRFDPFVVIGSLASFFRLDNGKLSAGSSPADEKAEHAAATPSDAALQALAARCQPSAIRWRPWPGG